MEQKKIDRINELAQKAKTTGLTEELKVTAEVWSPSLITLISLMKREIRATCEKKIRFFCKADGLCISKE